MLVSRARMSTLFALVKTHNYLIYISFPPQNRKPLCAPALCFPSPPTTTIRVIIQSASEQREKAPMSQAGAAGQQATEKTLTGSEMLRQEV